MFLKTALLRHALCAIAAGIAVMMAASPPAVAVSIELRDDAPDRIERQRAAASGKLPLPGTPDISQFENRLSAQGLRTGLPMFIRIFKAQSELEVWMEKDNAYVLFATYPICHWSGTLGPKIREGDKQTPEGFYTITSRQLHRLGRWTRALNLGYPNAFDESLKRDGSYILVHGGCSSVGCFAMTNPVIEEIYTLTSASLRAGQRHVPVHVFPFRMTQANLERHQQSAWSDFWLNLKEGYDAFEKTKRPPYVSVCDGRYRVDEMSASPPEAGGTSGPLAVCGPTAAALLDLDKSAWLVPLAPKAQEPQLTAASPPLPDQPPSNPPLPNSLPPEQQMPQPSQSPATPAVTTPVITEQLRSPSPPSAKTAAPTTAAEPETENRKAVASIDPALAYELVPRLVAPAPKAGSGTRGPALPCSLSLASCRKYAAMLSGRSAKGKTRNGGVKVRTAARAR